MARLGPDDYVEDVAKPVQKPNVVAHHERPTATATVKIPQTNHLEDVDGLVPFSWDMLQTLENTIGALSSSIVSHEEAYQRHLEVFKNLRNPQKQPLNAKPAVVETDDHAHQVLTILDRAKNQISSIRDARASKQENSKSDEKEDVGLDEPNDKNRNELEAQLTQLQDTILEAQAMLSRVSKVHAERSEECEKCARGDNILEKMRDDAEKMKQELQKYETDYHDIMAFLQDEELIVKDLEANVKHAKWNAMSMEQRNVFLIRIARFAHHKMTANKQDDPSDEMKEEKSNADDLKDKFERNVEHFCKQLNLGFVCVDPIRQEFDNNSDGQEMKLNDQSGDEIARFAWDRIDTLECKICYERFGLDRMFIFKDCFHYYCLGCLNEMLKIKITEKNGLKCIQCPSDECKNEISYFDIQNILLTSNDDETWGTYEKNLLETTFQMDADCKICPTPDCGYPMYGSKTDPNCTCPKCKKNFCFNCGATWWHSSEECQYYQLWKSENGENGDFNDWAAKNKCKRCPSCGTSIQKDGGCNHITCPTCKHEFHWKTDEKWQGYYHKYKEPIFDFAREFENGYRYGRHAINRAHRDRHERLMGRHQIERRPRRQDRPQQDEPNPQPHVENSRSRSGRLGWDLLTTFFWPLSPATSRANRDGPRDPSSKDKNNDKKHEDKKDQISRHGTRENFQPRPDAHERHDRHDRQDRQDRQDRRRQDRQDRYGRYAYGTYDRYDRYGGFDRCDRDRHDRCRRHVRRDDRYQTDKTNEMNEMDSRCSRNRLGRDRANESNRLDDMNRVSPGAPRRRDFDSLTRREQHNIDRYFRSIGDTEGGDDICCDYYRPASVLRQPRRLEGSDKSNDSLRCLPGQTSRKNRKDRRSTVSRASFRDRSRPRGHNGQESRIRRTRRDSFGTNSGRDSSRSSKRNQNRIRRERSRSGRREQRARRYGRDRGEVGDRDREHREDREYRGYGRDRGYAENGASEGVQEDKRNEYRYRRDRGDRRDRRDRRSRIDSDSSRSDGDEDKERRGKTEEQDYDSEGRHRRQRKTRMKTKVKHKFSADTNDDAPDKQRKDGKEDKK